MHSPDDKEIMSGMNENLTLEDLEYFRRKLYRALRINPCEHDSEINWKRVLKPLKQLTAIVEIAEDRKLI